MATKQELEVRVAELEAQLATSVPVEPPSVDAAVQDLKASMAELVAERDALIESNAQLSAERNVQADIAKAADAELTKLRAKTAATPVSSGQGVVLDGVPHVIIQRERMLDLVTAWRGRFVNDDDLVLVVKKA